MLTKFSHKCFTCCFILTAFLMGCGGGGSKSGASNTPTSSLATSSVASSTSSNTAPTLSGTFNLEAKAESTAILVLNAADKENDKLQITIPNKPDWLTAELANDQVTITAKPGFFDITDHKITLSVSDGKLSRDYPLLISVLDNPTKWISEGISPETLTGSWELDDGARLYIYPNGSGSYIAKDNKITLLKWTRSISGFIELEVPDPKVCSSCSTYIAISSVAKKSGYLRLLIDDSPSATNAKKLAFTAPAYNNYLNLYNYPSSGAFNQLSADGKDLSLRATVEINFSYGNNSKHNLFPLNFSARLNQSNTNSATFNLTELTDLPFSVSFTNINTNKSETLSFKPKITQIELMPSSAKDLITHITFKSVLTGASEKIDTANYGPALAAYLDQTQEIYNESVASSTIQAPSITVGDKYYLPNAAGRWSGVVYATADARSTATTLVFETSTKGYVLLDGPLFTNIQKTPFTWSTTNKTLTLTFENGLEAIDYTFALENGNLFALDSKNKIYGPAIKAATNFSAQVPTGFYFGTPSNKAEYFIYQYMFLSPTQPKGTSLVTTSVKSESWSNYYKMENDNSVTFLQLTTCSLGSFSACEESQKAKVAANELGASLTYINYKPIAKTGEFYSFLQTRYIIANTGSTISQSVINVTYDQFGLEH